MNKEIKYTKEEEKFINFLNNYKKFYKPAYKIAENKYGQSILSNKKGKNSFYLYSLDDICKSSNFKDKDINYTPKTTDAIWFKKYKEQFIIYLIEFKGDKLTNKNSKYNLKKYIEKIEYKYENAYGIEKTELEKDFKNLKKIYNKYSDDMLNNLALKPLETITISLPLIYQKYIEENKITDEINMNEFLKKSMIVFWVVALEIEDKNNINQIKERGNAYRLYNEKEITYQTNLLSFYTRYKKAKIIDDFDFIATRNFNNYINKAFN